MPTTIPMSGPDITSGERAAVAQVLRTPHLSIGPYVQAFEEATAAFVGTRHAAGANSGTSRTALAVRAAPV